MAEVRKLGANDLQIGEGTVVSPGLKTVQEINASHIPVAYGTANDAVTGYSNVVFSVEDALSSMVDVRAYGAVGDGATDDTTAIQAAWAAAESIYFPAGIWKFSTVLSSSTRKNIYGAGSYNGNDGTGTLLWFTGTGNAVSYSTDTFIYGSNIKNLSIRGNSNATNIFYLRHFTHGVFEDVNVVDYTNAGYLLETSVANQFNNVRASANEGAQLLSPHGKYGTYITLNAGAGDTGPSTVNTFINFLAEGLSDAGVYIAKGYLNIFVGGTSEQNKYGLYLDSLAENNHVNGMWFETNTDNDVYVNGTMNEFISMRASTAIADGFLFGSSAEANVVFGGYYRTITVNGLFNKIIGTTVYSGGVTDNGTSTYLAGVWFDQYNASLVDKYPNGIRIGATGSDTVNMKWGSTDSVTDGGTIAHGMGATPTIAFLTTTVSSQFASVSALDGTNITVTIKKDDGTAGSTQTIYWIVLK